MQVEGRIGGLASPGEEMPSLSRRVRGAGSRKDGRFEGRREGRPSRGLMSRRPGQQPGFSPPPARDLACCCADCWEPWELVSWPRRRVSSRDRMRRKRAFQRSLPPLEPRGCLCPRARAHEEKTEGKETWPKLGLKPRLRSAAASPPLKWVGPQPRAEDVATA